ncbi:MAG: ABC transporter permease [Lachnospiraceae bacterium]|nr:ABC transporter permease [Lachnospiraceae bacterium]
MKGLGNKSVQTAVDIERRYDFYRTVLSILIAFFITIILIFSISSVPLKDLFSFLVGPWQSLYRISNIIEKVIPLLFTGAAVCLMFKGGQPNLAVESAFYIGALAGTAVATVQGIPPAIHFLLCAAAGAAAGAVVCGIPAYLGVRFHVMVLVSSMMMNYIVMLTGQYLLQYHMVDPSLGHVASYEYAPSARLPFLFPGTKIHFGLVIGILVIVFTSILMFKTKLGYRARTIGENVSFAKYSGIKVGGTAILIQLMGGAMAGLGGTCETLGINNRFAYGGLTSHGWDGIMLAVIAGNDPKKIPLAALFLAYIRTGADILNRSSSMPTEVVKIIQAIVIALICAKGILSKREYKAIIKNAKADEA